MACKSNKITQDNLALAYSVRNFNSHPGWFLYFLEKPQVMFSAEPYNVIKKKKGGKQWNSIIWILCPWRSALVCAFENHQNKRQENIQDNGDALLTAHSLSDGSGGRWVFVTSLGAKVNNSWAADCKTNSGCACCTDSPRPESLE